MVILNRRLEPGQSLVRPGFTLIEILVTIGIVSLLLALVLPAVQGARNSASRMQCANNQRQLLLAIANYHDNYNMFPIIAWEYTDKTCAPDTALTRLFPYLELRSACEKLRANVKRIGLLECPADSSIHLVDFPLSYCLNASPGFKSGSNFSGPFGGGPTRSGPNVRAADVPDGLSSTAGLSETLGTLVGGTLRSASSKPARYQWSIPLNEAASSQLQITEDGIQNCVNGSRTFVPLTNPWQSQWFGGNFSGTSYLDTYTHWLPPNSPVCRFDIEDDNPNFFRGIWRAASDHSGGVNVGFLDGHVHFVSDRVDKSVWRAAGTRNGNEPTEGLP